jgi:hypothetical protein
MNCPRCSRSLFQRYGDLSCWIHGEVAVLTDERRQELYAELMPLRRGLHRGTAQLPAGSDWGRIEREEWVTWREGDPLPEWAL